MAVSLGSERAAVQDPLVGYAVEIGWVYLSRWFMSQMHNFG